MESGKLFKKIRENLKMMPREFAYELGLKSVSSVTDIELGHRPIPKKYFGIMRGKKLGSDEELDELVRLAEDERIEKDRKQYSQHKKSNLNEKKSNLDKLEEEIDFSYKLFKKGDSFINSHILFLREELDLINPRTSGENEKFNRLQAEILIFQAEIDLLASKSQTTREQLNRRSREIKELQHTLKAYPEKFEYATEVLTSLIYIFVDQESAYFERQARLRDGIVKTSKARAPCLRDTIGYPADAFSQRILTKADACRLFELNRRLAIIDMKERDYNPMDCAYLYGCIGEAAEKLGVVYFQDYINEAWRYYQLAEANGIYDMKIGARLLLIESRIFLRKPNIDIKTVIENIDPIVNFLTAVGCERYRDSIIESLLNHNDKQIRELGIHYKNDLPPIGIRYLPKSFL